MSLFLRRSEERSTVRLPMEAWAASFGERSWAGVSVTPESAMHNAAAAACVRVLTATIASLPVNAVRDGRVGSDVITAPPVVRRPSSRLTQRQWIAQMTRPLVSGGNAFGMITGFNGAGVPTVVEPVAPELVDEVNGRLLVDGVEESPFPSGRLLHVPAAAFARPGRILADSPTDMAKQAIGTSLAAGRFGAEFFAEGGVPSAVAKSSTELTRDQAEQIAARIKKAWQKRSPAVIGSGLEVEYPDQASAKDSQLLELLQFQIAEVCRFFGVPPSMVYASMTGQNITYQNITDSDLHYLKHSVATWLLDIEDAWSALLPSPQRVRFRAEALLRMDPTRRHDLYSQRLADKTMTVNEVRDLEDEPRFDEAFDQPGIPAAAAPTTPPPQEANDG